MRRTLRSCTSLLTIAAATAVSSVALGATYQVGPGKPYSDLAAVAPVLAPGDLVEVDGDATYPSVKFTEWGTSAEKITIRGIRVNGKRPVIAGGLNTVEVYANHYVLEGLDVTGGSSRCFFHHGDDITLRDAVIHDCPGHGLLGADTESGSLTMEYVEVYSAGAGDTKHPVYMATDEETYPGSVFRMRHCYVHDGNGGNNVKTRAERNEIYYNWIEGALYHELELIGPDGQDPDLAREDSDVVGNVFRKTSGSFVTRIGGDGTGDTSGRYRFSSNTFVLAQGSASAFRLFDGVESVEMHNNVFFRVGGGGVKIIQDADVAWATGSAVIGGSNNWVQTGSETVPAAWSGTIVGANPFLVDESGDDLQPISTSPLVDAASSAPSSPSGFAFPSPLAAPLFLPPPAAIQIAGGAIPRPVVGTMDIGAYEFGVDGGGSGASGTGSGGEAAGPSGSGGSGTGGDGNGSGTGGGGSTSGGGGLTFGAGGEASADGGSGAGGTRDPSGGQGADDRGGDAGARGSDEPGATTGDRDGFRAGDPSDESEVPGMTGACAAGRGAAPPVTAAFAMAAGLMLALRRRRTGTTRPWQAPELVARGVPSRRFRAERPRSPR